uniref:Coiled-coil domain containing 17 n=1 Tax=Ornithorhynchus anatinus TaxID=9258 RepID=F6R8P6_ORNAN
MGDPGLLRCQACDMVFRSRPLLDVHTQRLCIGRLTGEELRPPCPGLAPGLDAQPGPGNREQLRALEEAHARRLAEIQAQNRSLEQQRDGKFRMGGCCSSPSSPLLSNVLLNKCHHHHHIIPSLRPAAVPAPTRRALHLGYVQGGGRDRRVLTQMAELHTEATALESERKRSERKTSDPRYWGRGSAPRLPPPVAPPIATFPGPRRPLPGLRGKGENPGRFGGSQWGIRETPVPTHHILAPPDVLGPAPYDPAAGLVVFYDFLLGLERPWLQVRLVSGLARAGQELGTPTPLPTSPCLALPPARGRPRGSCAILASKQPVPRLRPCPTLSLLMVLEASGGFSPSGGELEGLKPRGWAKLRLFDPERRALSGRWRVPLRALPADPSLTPEQLNGVPQAGRAELYLRVANARDAEVQSLAEVDPSRAPDYLFPPPVGSLRPLPTSLGPLPADFVDPPPAREPSPQHTPSLG